MTRIAVVICSTLTLTLNSASAFAHHGFAGRYDEEHPVTVQATERWQAELGGASALRRVDGWTQTMLKAGDQLTIIGPQAKNGAPDMNLSHESKITMTATGKVIHNSIKAEQAAPAAPAN
jgi:hypothetical protein